VGIPDAFSIDGSHLPECLDNFARAVSWNIMEINETDRPVAGRGHCTSYETIDPGLCFVHEYSDAG
jgi:hypothetical protein